MTKHPDLFSALAAPFDESEVKARTQAGRQLHYITARSAMNRLDNVLGPENWWDEYTPHENSVYCRLTIRMPDGSTLTKCDAGGFAGMADSGDDDKSGYSDAFKRAAVKFGVSRYLYRDGVPSFVQDRTPVPVHPQDVGPKSSPRGENPPPAESAPPKSYNNPPRTGKALFAWTKDQEQRFEVGLLKYLNQWAKLNEFPDRMIDWDTEMVALAYKEAVRKLDQVVSGTSDKSQDND